MTNLNTVNNLNNPNLELLLTDNAGNVKKIDIPGLVTAFSDQIYEPIFCLPDVDIQNPMWSNGVNKIFSACPQVFVGIATHNPEYHLHVSGTSYTLKLKVGNKNATANSMLMAFAPNNSGDIATLGKKVGNQPQKVFFQITNDGSIITNNESGHILVSYNSSGDKVLQLEDGGLLRAREIKVDLVSWPDYVFEPDYDLMPLVELEKYIEENNHLPGFPAAVEIETSGLNLGEIQKMQMEKIEEHSLYIIDLNNEVESLKEENELLKNKLSNIETELAEIKELLK